MLRRSELQLVQQRLVLLQLLRIVTEVLGAGRAAVQSRRTAEGSGEGHLVACVEQHFGRLQQLVEVEAGGEGLTIAQA